MNSSIAEKFTFSINPRVIICGSRTSSREEDDALRRVIVARLEGIPRHWTIVIGYDPKKGTPRGADKITYQEARRMGFTVETHPADWERYKRGAGFVRNARMAQRGAQRCVAFWDGVSSGTKDMMDRAQLNNIPVEVVPWTKKSKRKRASTPSK